MGTLSLVLCMVWSQRLHTTVTNFSGRDQKENKELEVPLKEGERKGQ